MFRIVVAVALAACVSIAVVGCVDGDPSSAITLKPGEHAIPRIDPKKEEGIAVPGTDVELTITVRNGTGSKISMHWLEESTNDRVHYHDIEPGKEVSQDTWEGHFWLILDSNGKALGIYEAPDKDGVILIK